MSAADKKAPGRNPDASNSNNQHSDCAIPASGFKALAHLLYAAKALQETAEWPLDAQHGAAILQTRIARAIKRLEVRS